MIRAHEDPQDASVLNLYRQDRGKTLERPGSVETSLNLTMLNLQGSHYMESISRIFGKLDPADRQISSDQIVISAWRGAVGKKIASHTRAIKMVRTRLVVEVEDEIWQRQLFVMGRQILANLEKKVGKGLVDDLHFKIVPRRMEPQRAAASLFAQDEADRITDPVMRHIYKNARRKESA